jgi:HK97 family phage major capsid protein
MNQNTLFNLSKAFKNTEEYNNFKAQFIPKGGVAKESESLTYKMSTTKKEWNMDPKELQTMLDNAAKAAAEQATKALLDKQAAEAAEKAAAEKAAADLDARIKAALATVTPSVTGAEKLLADIEKRFAEQTESTKTTLEGLQSALAEKSAELLAMQKSKMAFSNGKEEGVSYKDKETAVLLSKISGKSIDKTKFGVDLLTKSGAHVAAGAINAPESIWETEVSMNMEEEVRNKLVIAPTLRSINMQTNVMKIPLNPEAGYGQWVANTSFGSVASAGNTATHALSEITLSAYKVATNEYIAYEEEEDSLLVILPIIRDAMVRRTAKSVDKAFLAGAGAGADPVKGLALYAPASADLAFPSVATLLGTSAVSNLRFLRKGLRAGGLDPSDIVYFVSTEVYYALMEDTLFQTMDKVGVNATILTGQVGQVAGSPVVVSAEFPSAVAGTATGTTNLAALAVAKSNWLVGNQRGLRFDMQDLAETQRKVLVASLRTGLSQLTTNLGTGVTAMRWAA